LLDEGVGTDDVCNACTAEVVVADAELVVEAELDMLVDPVDAALEVLLVPGSAKIVPKVGIYVESVSQQLVLLYAQHHEPPVVAALQAMIFTEELFPASTVSLSPSTIQIFWTLTVGVRQAIVRT
jgi:hypothetical protein